MVKFGAGCTWCACLAGLVLGGGAAFGQESASEPGRFPANQTQVQLTEVGTMRVTPRGVVPDGTGVFTTRACNVISTHTNASFTGGSYTAQAGFAQGELLAQTYQLTPADFPIKIDLSEAIFVTSGATQQTVTHWSILFFEGDPNTGNLVHTSSSDDVILPHLRVGPGTAGVNIQFSVDPQDPDQIILQNNGTARFTVAWRIDRHHQQTQNPCLFAPPTCCNAFPVTDNPTGGLAQPALNWLFGVNCGPFGCPPNGGWSRFSNLSTACRPGGDWVMRTTWSSVSCTPGVGSCCLPNGTCTVIGVNDCATLGGTYRGDGTDCTTPCPQPTGACCFPSGGCLSLTSGDCGSAGGTWLGANVACGSGNVCPLGACCLPSGMCASTWQANCTAQGGTFRGIGTPCSTANCPQPLGACCLANGSCLQLTQANCAIVPGTWYGPGVSCAAANCPQPTGACCLANGSCLILTQTSCNVIPGTFQGVNSTCASCTPPCDSIDFNNDGVSPDTNDLVDFLSVFGGGPCSTNNCNDIDFNNDNVAPDTDDLDDYIRVFGGGSC